MLKVYFLPPEYIWLAQAFRDHLDSYLDPSNRPTRSDDPRKFEDSGRVYEPIYDDAQTHILSALRDGTLTAFVLQYDGRLFVVPKEYWDDDFADATLAEGEFHGIGKSKNLKDRPIILHTKDWENWTEEHARSRDRRADDDAPTADQEQTNRKRDVEADALLKNQIEAVLALARTEWPKGKKFPGTKPAAKDLLRKHRGKLNYKFSAVCKILDGTYPASRRLGIPSIFKLYAGSRRGR